MVDNQNRYPDAAYAVLNIFYMDDYLGSVKNPETALMLSLSIVELLKLSGFNLTKFISNVPNLSSKLNPPKTSANNSKKIMIAAIIPETASQVLGLKWDHVTDTLILSKGVNRELLVRPHRSCRPVYRTFATERYLENEWPTVGRPTAK